MKRFKALGAYQKGILIFMAVTAFIFTVAYFYTTGRVGYEYYDAILVPEEKDGNITYSGKIKGDEAVFTVSEGQKVEFKYGDKVYGPYTVEEVPTAAPDNIERGGEMTGIEIYRGNDLLFRGGVYDGGGYISLYNDDGTPEYSNILITTDTGILTDERGNIIDPMEPSASHIVELISGPELTHKGEWGVWLEGIIVCIITAASILFADEIFRWNLRFVIQDADTAEPSDWAIVSRYISWTLLAVLATILFIVSLQ